MHHVAVLALLVSLVLAAPAQGAQVTLAWDPNPPAENVVAYRVWSCPAGLVSGCTQLAETARTEATLDLAFGSHFLRATAVNALGLSSEHSIEVGVQLTRPSKVNSFRAVVYLPRVP